VHDHFIVLYPISFVSRDQFRTSALRYGNQIFWIFPFTSSVHQHQIYRRNATTMADRSRPGLQCMLQPEFEPNASSLYPILDG